MSESKATGNVPCAVKFEEAWRDLSLDPCIRGGRIADAYCHSYREVPHQKREMMQVALAELLEGSEDSVILGVVSRLRHFVQYTLPFEEGVVRRELRSFFGPLLRGFLDASRDEDVVYEAIEALGWLGDYDALEDLYTALQCEGFRTYFGTATAVTVARIFAFIRNEYGFLDLDLNKRIDSISEKVSATLALPQARRLSYEQAATILAFSASVKGMTGLEKIAQKLPALGARSVEQWDHTVRIAHAVKVEV